MGNASANSARKREKEFGVGIQKKMEEEEKQSQKTATILIMGQGTKNFLNALHCIRDGGLDSNIQSQCKAYIWHQMIFEQKQLIGKIVNNNNYKKEWSSNLFKHCVTDKLLIYGFSHYDDKKVHIINSNIIGTIIKYYQSHDTINKWLNLLLFHGESNSSSIINHYVLNNVNIGQFIIDIYNEFNQEQKNKLLISYDVGSAHYFKSINRVCNKYYVPTSKDIILMSNSIGFSLNNRNKRYSKQSKHIVNNPNEIKDLQFKGSLYQFNDIQSYFKTKIKRWIYQFEDGCDCLIFLIPLTTYYKWNTNWDTFNLIANFTAITNNNYLKKACFHLFLTEKEIFEKKLKTQQFKFAEYNGDNSYQSAIKYLINYLMSKLIADNKGDKRELYVHVISLFHLEQLKNAFSEICTMINRNDIKNIVAKHHKQMSSQKFQM